MGFFQPNLLCFVLCYCFHVVRWGLSRRLDLILCLNGLILRQNGFLVIINDDFLEMGECRGNQIFFSATCPGQVASTCPEEFFTCPKIFCNCISFGQVANTTISDSKCNSNQTVVDEGSSDL